MSLNQFLFRHFNDIPNGVGRPITTRPRSYTYKTLVLKDLGSSRLKSHATGPLRKF